MYVYVFMYACIQHTHTFVYFCLTFISIRNAYKILVERAEGKRPLGRPRHVWENNNIMGLRDLGWGIVDWIHMSQDRNQWLALVNTVMDFRVM
jgi:hypothetical protein